MSTRHELSDGQWAVIEPLLPKPKPGPGRPPAAPRKTLNGILYVLKTGCTWADMPRQYGSPTTCWRRLKQWSEDGTWERIWRALLSRWMRKKKSNGLKLFLTVDLFPPKKGKRDWKNQGGQGNQGHDGIGWKRGADRSVSGQRPPS